MTSINSYPSTKRTQDPVRATEDSNRPSGQRRGIFDIGSHRKQGRKKCIFIKRKKKEEKEREYLNEKKKSNWKTHRSLSNKTLRQHLVLGPVTQTRTHIHKQGGGEKKVDTKHKNTHEHAYKCTLASTSYCYHRPPLSLSLRSFFLSFLGLFLFHL